MSKKDDALKLALEWIEDAVVVLSHTSSSVQGGVGAEAEGVGGCSVKVVAAIREALAQSRSDVEQPAQQEPVAFSQFLSDVVTAAGLLSHGKTDKSLAARISKFAFRLRTSPPASKPWVGLSTIELDEIDAPIRERGHATIAEIYRAIEAKLREKNA